MTTQRITDSFFEGEISDFDSLMQSIDTRSLSHDDIKQLIEAFLFSNVFQDTYSARTQESTTDSPIRNYFRHRPMTDPLPVSLDYEMLSRRLAGYHSMFTESEYNDYTYLERNGFVPDSSSIANDNLDQIYDLDTETLDDIESELDDRDERETSARQDNPNMVTIYGSELEPDMSGNMLLTETHSIEPSPRTRTNLDETFGLEPSDLGDNQDASDLLLASAQTGSNLTTVHPHSYDEGIMLRQLNNPNRMADHSLYDRNLYDRHSTSSWNWGNNFSANVSTELEIDLLEYFRYLDMIEPFYQDLEQEESLSTEFMTFVENLTYDRAELSFIHRYSKDIKKELIKCLYFELKHQPILDISLVKYFLREHLVYLNTHIDLLSTYGTSQGFVISTVTVNTSESLKLISLNDGANSPIMTFVLK